VCFGAAFVKGAWISYMQNIAHIFHYYYSVTFLNMRLTFPFMTFNLDDKLKALCEPLSDVKYVVGMNFPRMYLNSIEQYSDLMIIYTQPISNNGSSHMELLFDGDGVKYAKLFFSGIKYALSMSSSIIPEKKFLKHAKDVSLRNAKHISEPECLADRLVEDKILMHDLIDFAGGISNVAPRFASNKLIAQSFAEHKDKRNYFLN